MPLTEPALRVLRPARSSGRRRSACIDWYRQSWFAS